MELWLIWIIVGAVFFIIELFTPMLFFLNLAFAAFLGGAVAAYLGLDVLWQILIFGGMSALLLLCLRPLLVKKFQTNDTTTGLDEKYIGQNAKTVALTNANEGRVAIYGEEWMAKSNDGSEIPAESIVKIIRNEGTIFFVEKIEG